MSQAANSAFYTLDRELRLTGASPNTLRMWGKTMKELQGRKLVEAFPFAENGPVHRALEDALRTLQPKRLRVESRVLNQVVDVEIYPVRDGLQVSFRPAR
jgi:hypothetical protein